MGQRTEMKTITPEELQKLCDDHWEYTQQIGELLYKLAMAHGFKHGVQWIEEKMRRVGNEKTDNCIGNCSPVMGMGRSRINKG